MKKVIHIAQPFYIKMLVLVAILLIAKFKSLLGV
jgi:hypothetical protein